MEELGVETAGEGLDVVGREGVAADHDAVADDDVLEKGHAAPPGVRRPSIIVEVIVVMTVSASSMRS